MALPDNTLSSTPMQSALIAPDNGVRLNLREDFERGGVALNDPTQGLTVRTWKAWTDDGSAIFVAPLPSLTPTTTVLTGAGITEVALAFDQNMEVTVAYVEAGATKLRWYDSQAAAMVTTAWPGVSSPMLAMDDKRAFAGNANDIIFGYIRAGLVCYRQQRDRYGVEYVLGEARGTRIEQLGMGVNNRLQFKVATQAGGVYSDLSTDRLFVFVDGGVQAIGDGPARFATWRSKTYQPPEQPAPGWGRVEGDYPVQVSLIGDGEVVYTTPQITNSKPFRFPGIRCREWALEVTGATRVVQVAVSTDRTHFD